MQNVITLLHKKVAVEMILNVALQVNFFQKHLFLHQLNRNMTKYCSLNYKFNTWKLQAQYMLCTQCFLFLFWHSEQFMYTTCSDLVIFMYWTGNSMNNLLSYCGLVDARISASEKDLPVHKTEIYSFLFPLIFQWNTSNCVSPLCYGLQLQCLDAFIYIRKKKVAFMVVTIFWYPIFSWK